MNKRQLATFARSKGWSGDDARTPLAIIVQWLNDNGHPVGGVVGPSGVAAPAPIAAPQEWPTENAGKAFKDVWANAQPAPVHAPVIQEAQPAPQPAASPMSAFDAYIETRITDMLDAYTSAQPQPAPVHVPAPTQQPSLDTDAVQSIVADTLRRLFPQPSDDAPIVLPDDALAAVAAASAVTRAAADVFRGATVTKELTTHGVNVRTVPASARTPAIDASYQFDPEALRLALICDAMLPTTGRIWLAGPKGAGKTQFASQYAARTGRPFYRINFEGSVERYELIGGQRLEAGSSVWQDGAFTAAIQVPHAVILLDEPSFCRPHNAASLQPVLERDGTLTITESGRVIRPAVGVLFICADNTMGQGDASGRYAGTVEQNTAWLDRMSYIIALTPPSAAVETRLLIGRTGIVREAAKLVAEFSRQCRRANESGALVDAVSLRQTEAFCHALVAGLPAQSAFTASIVNKASVESAEALQQLFAAHLGDTLRAALNEPISAPIDPSAPPAQQDANEGEQV